MAQGSFGFILITASAIVKVSGRQEHIHVNPFGDPYVFTQPVNPEGVIPFVAAPNTLEMFVRMLFYDVEHGLSNRARRNLISKIIQYSAGKLPQNVADLPLEGTRMSQKCPFSRDTYTNSVRACNRQI
jgi:hypothetical protein